MRTKKLLSILTSIVLSLQLIVQPCTFANGNRLDCQTLSAKSGLGDDGNVADQSRYTAEVFEEIRQSDTKMPRWRSVFWSVVQWLTSIKEKRGNIVFELSRFLRHAWGIRISNRVRQYITDYCIKPLDTTNFYENDSKLPALVRMLDPRIRRREYSDANIIMYSNDLGSAFGAETTKEDIRAASTTEITFNLKHSRKCGCPMLALLCQNCNATHPAEEEDETTDLTKSNPHREIIKRFQSTFGKKKNQTFTMCASVSPDGFLDPKVVEFLSTMPDALIAIRQFQNPGDIGHPVLHDIKEMNIVLVGCSEEHKEMLTAMFDRFSRNLDVPFRLLFAKDAEEAKSMAKDPSSYQEKPKKPEQSLQDIEAMAEKVQIDEMDQTQDVKEVTIFVGSPISIESGKKSGKESTSYSRLALYYQKLYEKRGVKVNILDYSGLRGQKLDTAMQNIAKSQVLMVCAPLHCDGLPWPVMDLFKKMKEHTGKTGQENVFSRLGLYMTINCGFPDARNCACTTLQSGAFAKSIGAKFYGAHDIGGGHFWKEWIPSKLNNMLSAHIQAPSEKRMTRAIDMIMAKKSPGLHYTTPIFPPFAKSLWGVLSHLKTKLGLFPCRISDIWQKPDHLSDQTAIFTARMLLLIHSMEETCKTYTEKICKLYGIEDEALKEKVFSALKHAAFGKDVPGADEKELNRLLRINGMRPDDQKYSELTSKLNELFVGTGSEGTWVEAMKKAEIAIKIVIFESEARNKCINIRDNIMSMYNINGEGYACDILEALINASLLRRNPKSNLGRLCDLYGQYDMLKLNGSNEKLRRILSGLLDGYITTETDDDVDHTNARIDAERVIRTVVLEYYVSNSISTKAPDTLRYSQSSL